MYTCSIVALRGTEAGAQAKATAHQASAPRYITKYQYNYIYMDIDEETSDEMMGRDSQPEATTQEFRDMTEVGLTRELTQAMTFMGPGQLATVISVAITDTEYLKDFVRQITNNLNGR